MANIKKMFPEFFQSKLENNDLVNAENNLIVLDTNFLLDIIQLPTDIAKTYVEALDKVKDNLYIPYLVALEFNFRKSGIKKGKHHNINKYKDSVKSPIESLKKNILNYSSINIKENSESFSKDLIEKVDDFQVEILEILDEKVAEAITKEENTLYERLINIIENKVGEKYSQSWIDSIETDGEIRYEKQIPPGFDDENKENETEKSRRYGDILYQRKFGDLIIWKDIIKYSHANPDKGPKVIYITNDGQSDKKQDLLYKVDKLIVGPHISLMNELQVEADKEFYILSNLRFVQLISNLSDDEMKEIERLSTSLTSTNISYLNNNIQREELKREKFEVFEEFKREMEREIEREMEQVEILKELERERFEDSERLTGNYKRNPFEEDRIEKARYLARLNRKQKEEIEIEQREQQIREEEKKQRNRDFHMLDRQIREQEEYEMNVRKHRHTNNYSHD